jgi:hypothetical protein
MRVVLIVLAVVLVVVSAALAEIPQMISYQGRVTDAAGAPVADGTYDMRFRIYDAATGGDMEWDSGTRSVQVEGGVFSVLLGESPQPTLDLPFDEDCWLLVTFDGVNQSPRQRFASAGYAYMASGLVPGTTVEGPVTSALRAISTLTSGVAQGGYFESAASSGRAVYGRNTHATGTTCGGRFVANSTSGRGVRGEATASTGTTYGGYFNSSSSSGRGVRGWASSTSGTTYGGYFTSNSSSGRGAYAEAPLYGVQGVATGTSGVNYGGYFETASTSGTGVRGIATATTGSTYGVYGRSYSTGTDSRGVYGRSYATTGVTFGVYGRTATSSQGYGVYGYASSGTGDARGGGFHSENSHGVCGWAGATTGDVYGVFGHTESTSGVGVYGYAAPTTGEPDAVYGWCRAPSGYAVHGRSTAALPGSFHPGAAYFEHTHDDGVGVTGSGGYSGGHFWSSSTGNDGWVGRETWKIVGWGSVSFMQNHPYRDDRVIVYAAPEGDEVATYTRGTGRLTDGEARVPLGETFQWVTNPDIGLTAHITPRGGWEDLYVKSISTKELVVASRDGTGEAMFDYIVYGLRIGFEEQSIVQEKQEEAYIPSMVPHRERYSEHPDLRKYNALERFKAMRVAADEGQPVDLAASQALRDAIEEYDPAVHGHRGSSGVSARDTEPIVPRPAANHEDPAEPDGVRAQAPELPTSARETR